MKPAELLHNFTCPVCQVTKPVVYCFTKVLEDTPERIHVKNKHICPECYSNEQEKKRKTKKKRRRKK